MTATIRPAAAETPQPQPISRGPKGDRAPEPKPGSGAGEPVPAREAGQGDGSSGEPKPGQAQVRAEPVSVARARLAALFDTGTFEEIGAEVLHRASAFGLDKRKIPGDGVVTGFGQILGRAAYAYAQDRTVLGGSLGEAHALKIARLQDLALKSGAPFIGINDSGGARIQEGVDSLAGYGEIFHRNVRASGIIPQISLILGPCAGGAVYSPALTDFVGMVERQSYMFLTGPKVVKTVTFEEVSVEELGGAAIHANRTGVTHFCFGGEIEALTTVRRLLGYLPSNCNQKPPRATSLDPVDRLPEGLEELVPRDPKKPYDMRRIVEAVVDTGSFLEVHAAWAQNVLVGFARLGGFSVGVVANQPAHLAGVLDIDASRKAARFIRTCNAFNVPLLSFVDVPGFLPGVDQEHGGVIDHGAKLMYAYCEATVPKLAVIVRKAYGGAYIVMSSKHVGGDCNLAWPTAQIAVMGAKGAVEILYSKELSGHPEPEKRAEELVREYEARFLTPARAAERGYVDEVVAPCETRRKLFRYLQALEHKSEPRLPRRNGNIPT
jgi:acetyl-CoA carboxylase carboxyltransferase component